MFHRKFNRPAASACVLIALFCLAPTLVAKPTVTAPKTQTGQLAKGTAWQTPYYIMDTGKSGPTVIVTGGMHGNEPAGYRAAEQIRHWPIAKGKLIVIPATNVPGLKANTRNMPDVDKELANLNRNFPGEGKKNKARGLIASDIWKLTQRLKPQWVIDLHEGYEFNKSHKPPKGKKKSVGSSIIYFKGPQMDPLIQKMQQAVNNTVEDPDRKFTLLSRGPINTSYARAAVKHLGAKGMILETTFKDQPLSTRTRQHRIMVNVLLNKIGMIDRNCVDIMTASASDPKAGPINVALYDATGTGAKGIITLTRILDKAPDIQVHHLGPADFQSADLDQFDAVLFPGGSGSKEAAAIGKTGRRKVRDFVSSGRGYLGICAGAFLCSAHYSWSLHLVDTSTFTGAREIPGKGKKQMWYRGKTSTVKMQLTKQGQRIFKGIDVNVEVRYQNGPIVSHKKDPKIPDYTPLAYFRSEKVLWEPQRGTMINTPAIISAHFQKGRVIAISPHPESTPSLEPIITQSIRWITRRLPEDDSGPFEKQSRALQSGSLEPVSANE